MSLFSIKTVCLKLTGESLMKEGQPLSSESLKYIISQIKKVLASDVKISIVLGGGNIYRGVQGDSFGIGNNPNSDYMGMLATAINGIALSTALLQEGIEASLYSSFKIGSFVKEFSQQKAKQDLLENKVVVFCGGTGNPFFTTDTAAVLRSLEMGADLLLKGTKVDGIYDKDPKKHENAKKFKALSYDHVLSNHYQIMDQSAFALCYDKNLPLVVFDFFNPESLPAILKGSIEGTLVASQDVLNQFNLKGESL